MSDEEKGLEVAAETVTTQEATAKGKKVNSAEETSALVAGVALMNQIGTTENLKKVLPLVSVWNSGDKEALATQKEATINAFGGSEALKDYMDGTFNADVEAFAGVAKAIPTLNNIHSFYARRATSTKKVKLVQISIDGSLYSVNAAYKESINSLPNDEKKQLLLAHADTKKAAVEEII